MSKSDPICIVTRVTDDEGSSILAVYTDEVLADKFVELYNATHSTWDSRAEVEKHIPNPHMSVLNGDCRFFKVTMTKDGAEAKVEELKLDLTKSSSHMIHSDRKHFDTCLWASSAEHASAIADLHRNLLIETGQW